MRNREIEKLGNSRIIKLFSISLFLIFPISLTSCTWGVGERQKPAAAAAPYSFWVPDNVAAEFRQYPEGHPMREFFKMYVNQQRQLDAYHGYPGSYGTR